MSKGQLLIANASWMYGSQIATVVVQMAYAALTSRLVDAEGFAAYGVALAVGALTLLLANGGLGQAVGRMDLLEPTRIRSLTAYSVLLGFAGAALLYITAPFWADLWGTHAAEDPLKIMSIAVLVSPLLGLSSGLLRRQGKFRTLSIAIFTCNLTGMLLGLIAVYVWPSAGALIISGIASQLALMLICTFTNWRLLLGPFSSLNKAEDLAFSWKLTAVSIVGYFNGNIGKFAVSNYMPAGSLGFWNRADVVTTIPFMQVQNAIIQAVYPEFRHDLKGGSRASFVWVDLLTLVAWVALPAAAVASVLVPEIAGLLFGPGWAQAAQLAGPLALVAGIQIMSTVLASAVEALGKFKWIWITQLLLLFIYVCSAAWCYLSREWYPIIIGLFAAQITQHIIHIVFCGRIGYLDSSLLIIRYLRIMAFSAFLALATWLVLTGLRTSAVIWIIVAASGLSIAGVIFLWKYRYRLEPFQIAQKYRHG